MWDYLQTELQQRRKSSSIYLRGWEELLCRPHLLASFTDVVLQNWIQICSAWIIDSTNNQRDASKNIIKSGRVRLFCYQTFSLGSAGKFKYKRMCPRYKEQMHCGRGERNVADGMHADTNHGTNEDFWILSAAGATGWRCLCQQRGRAGEKRRQCKTQGFLQLCKFSKHLKILFVQRNRTYWVEKLKFQR